MGKVYAALVVAALALGLLFPAHQTLADEAADLEAVEQELEAETIALELYKRARERAVKAVQASSLAAKHDRLWEVSREALEAHKRASGETRQAWDRESAAWDMAREAEREAQIQSIGALAEGGEDGIDASLRVMKEWQENDRTRPRAMALSEETKEFREVENRLWREYRSASDAAFVQSERMGMMIDKMTLKFLADEIAKAVEQELGDLERELREIEGKVRRGVTI